MEELPRFNGAPTRGIGESAEWSNMHRLAQCAYQQQNRPPPSLNIDALQPLINRIVQGPPTRHGGGRRQNHPFDFRRVIVRHPVVRASFLRRFLAEVIDSSLITLPVASFLMGLGIYRHIHCAHQHCQLHAHCLFARDCDMPPDSRTASSPLLPHIFAALRFDARALNRCNRLSISCGPVWYSDAQLADLRPGRHAECKIYLAANDSFLSSVHLLHTSPVYTVCPSFLSNAWFSCTSDACSCCRFVVFCFL